MIAMMRQVNVHEAKTNLSALLTAVEAGEEVVIARSGRPVARLVRFTPVFLRPIGLEDGKLVIADDFDDPLPEFEPYCTVADR
jgi:antitoxin (DNA-binding transcriptional repressor) of toxin-antitoxin stability system